MRRNGGIGHTAAPRKIECARIQHFANLGKKNGNQMKIFVCSSECVQRRNTYFGNFILAGRLELQRNKLGLSNAEYLGIA